jgi:hypothetical protein
MRSVQINSTSVPAINAAYALDPQTQSNITAVSAYVVVNGKFPDGLPELPFFDVGGTPRMFPTTALFLAFATAYADFVTALDIGQSPKQPVTIA